jgi:uncharacterized protein YggE
MRFRLGAILLILAILPLPVSAQTARDSIITVSATRTGRVRADRATFYLIVEGTAETPADAVARVDTKLKGVTDALRAFGPRVVVDAPMAYGVGPTPAPNGYPGVVTPPTQLARSVLRVQLSRADQVANVVAAAIAAGASNSSSLSFESSVADSVRRVRMTEAIGIARADAEAVAHSLGVELGALVSVNSGGGPIGFQPPPMLVFDNRYGSPNAAPPEITVNGTATLQFRVHR